MIYYTIYCHIFAEHCYTNNNKDNYADDSNRSILSKDMLEFITYVMLETQSAAQASNFMWDALTRIAHGTHDSLLLGL